jgi:hypothetical protein
MRGRFTAVHRNADLPEPISLKPQILVERPLLGHLLHNVASQEAGQREANYPPRKKCSIDQRIARNSMRSQRDRLIPLLRNVGVPPKFRRRFEGSEYRRSRFNCYCRAVRNSAHRTHPAPRCTGRLSCRVVVRPHIGVDGMDWQLRMPSEPAILESRPRHATGGN